MLTFILTFPLTFLLTTVTMHNPGDVIGALLEVLNLQKHKTHSILAQASVSDDS